MAVAGQVESVRRMFAWQLRGSLSLLVLLLAIDVAILGVSLSLKTILLTWPFMLSVWGTYRAAQRASRAKETLRLLDAKHAPLPRATLVSK